MLVVQDYTWKECLDSLNMDNIKRRTPNVCGVNKSYLWIKKILQHNNIDVKQFVNDVRNIIDRRGMKRNTLEFGGDSDAGKSLLTNCIAASCIYPGINNQLNRQTSQFGMQEFVYSRIIVFDEISISEEFKDKILLVTAGMPCDTDVKNKGRDVIFRTPVILCYNKHPAYSLSIRSQGTFLKALNTRTIPYKFKEMPDLADFKGNLNPLVWKIFYDEYIDEVESDNEQDFDDETITKLRNTELPLYDPETDQLLSPIKRSRIDDNDDGEGSETSGKDHGRVHDLSKQEGETELEYQYRLAIHSPGQRRITEFESQFDGIETEVDKLVDEFKEHFPDLDRCNLTRYILPGTLNELKTQASVRGEVSRVRALEFYIKFTN